jgi:hypothetical protein
VMVITVNDADEAGWSLRLNASAPCHGVAQGCWDWVRSESAEPSVAGASVPYHIFVKAIDYLFHSCCKPQ